MSPDQFKANALAALQADERVGERDTRSFRPSEPPEAWGSLRRHAHFTGYLSQRPDVRPRWHRDYETRLLERDR